VVAVVAVDLVQLDLALVDQVAVEAVLQEHQMVQQAVAVVAETKT
jgi:hypothetical protein